MPEKKPGYASTGYKGVGVWCRYLRNNQTPYNARGSCIARTKPITPNRDVMRLASRILPPRKVRKSHNQCRIMPGKTLPRRNRSAAYHMPDNAAPVAWIIAPEKSPVMNPLRIWTEPKRTAVNTTVQKKTKAGARAVKKHAAEHKFLVNTY